MSREACMDQRTKGKLEMIIAILWDEVKKERRWAVVNGKRFLPRPFRITCEQLAEWSGFSMEKVEEIDKLFVECNLNITREWVLYLQELQGFDKNRMEHYVNIVAEVIFQLRLGGVRMSYFEDYDIYLENKYVGGVNEEEVKLVLYAYCSFLVDRIQRMLDKGWDYEVISLMVHKKPFDEALFSKMKAYVGMIDEEVRE